MNNELHNALATQLDSTTEISFMYNGFICYIQDCTSCTESDWTFDIGEREDESHTDHLDGGYFTGSSSDCIQFVINITGDL